MFCFVQAHSFFYCDEGFILPSFKISLIWLLIYCRSIAFFSLVQLDDNSCSNDCLPNHNIKDVILSSSSSVVASLSKKRISSSTDYQTNRQTIYPESNILSAAELLPQDLSLHAVSQKDNSSSPPVLHNLNSSNLTTTSVILPNYSKVLPYSTGMTVEQTPQGPVVSLHYRYSYMYYIVTV